MKKKNKAAILGILLGIVGGHRWYLGQTGKALLCIPGGLFTGPIFGLYWLLSSQESFDNEYNKQAIQKEQINVQKEMLNAIKNK
jgi:TM2 domain-containing membrane protein YozV